ncbi:MAG: carbohydrate ABC transporter permease [Janthinobacterium lividum]
MSAAFDLEAATSGGTVLKARRRFASLPWLLLAPSLALLGLFTYGPVGEVLVRSLQVRRFGLPMSYGLANYTALLGDDRFLRALGNTVVYAVGTIVPSLALALLFALALREGTWLASAVRTLLVLPMMVPLVAAAALFTFIFLPGAGLLDHYLGFLGLGAANWLGDPGLAMPSIIAITIWKNTGYYMLFFLAGLAAVPQDLLDAARMEGAGAVARLRHIILPLLGPTVGRVAWISRFSWKRSEQFQLGRSGVDDKNSHLASEARVLR